MEPLTANNLLNQPDGFFVFALLCDCVGDTQLGFWDAATQRFEGTPVGDLDSALRFLPMPEPTEDDVASLNNEASQADLELPWLSF